jgi:hypothetical protein
MRDAINLPFILRLLLLIVLSPHSLIIAQNLRHFDPKNEKDCKCVKSMLKRDHYLQEGYRRLAESYKNTMSSDPALAMRSQ